MISAYGHHLQLERSISIAATAGESEPRYIRTEKREMVDTIRTDNGEINYRIIVTVRHVVDCGRKYPLDQIGDTNTFGQKITSYHYQKEELTI